MHIHRLLGILGLSMVCVVGIMAPVSADTLTSDITTQIDTAGGKAGLAKENPQRYIASFIQILLGLIGTLFLILLIYAGYMRLTAHGDEDRIETSNKTITRALLGLIVVLLSYGITRFIVTRVYNASTSTPVYEENNSAPDEVYERSIDLNIF